MFMKKTQTQRKELMVHFENTMNMVPYNNFWKQYMFGP